MWSGQHEYMQRVRERLNLVVPVTLLIIFFLLYLNFRNATESLIVMLSLPFAAVEAGAGLRLRPVMMTVAAITLGLIPIMWGHGAGSEIMRRIAAPMIGGMVSVTVLALLVVPAVYSLWRERQERKRTGTADPVES